MTTFEVGLYVLLVHGALGAFDTIAMHEWQAKLPRHAWAQHELALHAARTFLYGVVFIGLAWFEWHGAVVVLLAAVLAMEYAVTLVDSLVEDRTRRLSPTERVVHMILGATTGAYAALVLYHAFTHWFNQPTTMVPTQHGWVSFALSVYAIGVLISGVRDAVASQRLRAAVARADHYVSGTAQ